MKHKPFLLIILILLIVIAVLLVCLLRDDPAPAPTPTPQPGLVYEPAGSSGQLKADISLPNIIIPGWTGIRLPAGKTEASVSLNNPEANKDYYDLTFTLRLKDGTEIFTTNLVAPGETCTSVTLLQELEPGEYPAHLFVQPYLRDDSHSPLNNADLEILLIVE